MTIGIMGALDAEIEEYVKNAVIVEKKEWSDFVFYEARLFGKEAVIVKSGAGKVFSSMVCQKMIDEYGPERIIFTGVGGALNRELDIGDVVVSKDCIQHDMDGRALGFGRGRIVFTDYRIFTADVKMKNMALQSKINNRLIEGRILTGDQFIVRGGNIEYDYLTEELKGDVADMEGAAVGQVCALNKIPFVLVRTISDKAEGNAGEDFESFLPVVAKNSYSVVKTIIQNI